MRLLLIGLASAFVVAACGQKGPLYLRDSPPPGIKPAKADTYKPVPYPKDTEGSREPDKN
jgi:predicted small lipoprotein YifL